MQHGNYSTHSPVPLENANRQRSQHLPRCDAIEQEETAEKLAQQWGLQCTLVIPVLRELREKDHKLQGCLGPTQNTTTAVGFVKTPETFSNLGIKNTSGSW